MMTRYPAAERFAGELLLDATDTLETALPRWRAAFVAATHQEPSAEMIAAAEHVLHQRITGVLPPPSSASGAWAREPALLRGIGEE